MLVNFKTEAYATVTMFGSDALQMLKIMGHSGTIPGAILADDVPAAQNRLSTAMDAEKAEPPAQDTEADVVTVSLAHRGLPLLTLLTAASKAKCNVMWE
jgi:hypothetical protein